MPTYEYLCECGHSYEEFRPITEPHPKKCPECGLKYGDGFDQAWMNSRQVGVVMGNPTTVGQMAELNRKRLGKERSQMREEAEEDSRSDFTGKLPKGAKPLKNTVKPKTPWWRSGEVKGLEKSDKPLDIRKVKDKRKFVETGIM